MQYEYNLETALVLLAFNFILHSLTHIQLHPLMVAPLTNLAKVMVQRLCNCNSIAWGWHNSYQSEVIGITMNYSPVWIKAPRYTGGTIM